MRAADPDNNKKVGASSSTPPLHAEVRAKLQEIEVPKLVVWVNDEMKVETTKLTDKTINEICQAVADALLAALPEKLSLDEWKYGDSEYPLGFNDGVAAVTRVIGALKD